MTRACLTALAACFVLGCAVVTVYGGGAVLVVVLRVLKAVG